MRSDNAAAAGLTDPIFRPSSDRVRREDSRRAASNLFIVVGWHSSSSRYDPLAPAGQRRVRPTPAEIHRVDVGRMHLGAAVNAGGREPPNLGAATFTVGAVGGSRCDGPVRCQHGGQT